MSDSLAHVIAAFVASAASLIVAAPARADSTEAPTMKDVARLPSDTVAPSTGASDRRRGHVYFRGSGGAAYLRDEITIDGAGVVQTLPLALAGTGAALDVAFGAMLTDSIALGGQLVLTSVSGPALHIGERRSESSGLDSLTFTMFGPVVDAFLSRDSGFHVQCGVGWSRIGGSAAASQSSAGESSAAPSGPGLSLAAGYDWQLSRHVALGIVARARGAVMTTRSQLVETKPGGGVTRLAVDESHLAYEPSLSLSLAVR